MSYQNQKSENIAILLTGSINIYKLKKVEDKNITMGDRESEYMKNYIAKIRESQIKVKMLNYFKNVKSSSSKRSGIRD